MSSQTVKRLSSLEIDEVSLVDRPANQHGLVTITKRDEGTPMGVYDETGQPLDETTLQSGDLVYDDDGQPFRMLSEDDVEAIRNGEVEDEVLAELGFDEEALTALLEEGAEELAPVGKGLGSGAAAVTGGVHTKIQAGRKLAGRYIDDVKLGFSHGRSGRDPGTTSTSDRARKVGAHLGRNRDAYIAGGAVGTEENVRGRFRKSAAPSLGEQVLSDLSKALTDGDRDGVISKVAQRVEQAELIAKAAQERAEALEAEREFEQFVEIGKSFQLPVDHDELGGILQAVSKVLTDDQLETFERILNTAAAAVSLEEAGSSGVSPTMDYVEGAALELVGKSAGEATIEQATTALYSANEEAYLAYLSENQR